MPYFNFIKKKYSIIIIIIVALLIGFDNQFNDFLGLYRIIFYLPIFALGYCSVDLKASISKYNKYRSIFIIAFIVATFVIFIAIFNHKSFSQILFYAYTQVFGYDHNVYNFAIRVFAFFSSCAISVTFFLFLIPTRKTFFTKYGKNTLNVFLLHTFLVWPLNEILSPQSDYFIIYALLLSLIITIILSFDIVNRISSPITNFNFFNKRARNKN